ncbi:riboflavin synthase [bacterium]|nr:riboflavin synthase [bacterium]
MFSGIVEATGRVRALERRPGGDAVLSLDVGFDPATLVSGESIATNGVCLTVRTIEPTGFAADLSGETLSRTTLGSLAAGDVVNLERSLRVGDRISGHFVFGHVDGEGVVDSIRRDGEGWRFTFGFAPAFAPFVVDKGSVAVDGISLTLCDCTERSFDIAVIPHTFEATNLHRRRVGDRVNLEADMLARYVRRAIACGVDPA